MTDLTNVIASKLRGPRAAHRQPGERGSGVYVTYGGRKRQLVQGHGLSPKPMPGTVPVITTDGRRWFAKPSEFVDRITG